MVGVGFGGWILVARIDVIGCCGWRVVIVGIIDDVLLFALDDGADAIVDVGILLTVVAAAMAICRMGGCH